ncbi:PH domain-containing protein [Rhizobium rhizogenes]|uniref:PH domain-containing protein n=1 Tax=Rhizobium rhizogenes TaxID=359 RepID=UPI001571E369|nr:PH domain-containing protein [Rhizobium rhizogenes]NTF72824.1 PH domain-containing protein [Rhizobium rhizogenes]
MEDDEQEPLTIYRLSKIIFVGPILIAGLGTAALWYVWTSNLNLMHNLGPMVLGLERYESIYPTIFLACRILTAVIAMGLATHVLACLIRYLTTELRIFSNRVLWRTGFISRDVFTTSVREIIGVQFTQSVLGRILGFGSISISTRGDDQIVADLINGAPQASRTIMALKNNGGSL